MTNSVCWCISAVTNDYHIETLTAVHIDTPMNAWDKLWEVTSIINLARENLKRVSLYTSISAEKWMHFLLLEVELRKNEKGEVKENWRVPIHDIAKAQGLEYTETETVELSEVN